MQIFQLPTMQCESTKLKICSIAFLSSSNMDLFSADVCINLALDYI